VRISFGGSLSKEVCSRSSPSLTPWLARKVVASFRIVCVGLRLLRCRVFFFFFFFVVGGHRQDTYCGKSQEDTCYHNGQMLLVQEK